MKLHFWKLEGTGNDFVVIDNRTSELSLKSMIALSPQLCDRKRGIGADGFMAIQSDAHLAFEMIYRNADGSDAGMCGNGARCISLLAHHLGMGTSFSFRVHDSKYHSEIADNAKQVIVRFSEETQAEQRENSSGQICWFIRPGTEHCVEQHQSLTDRDSLKKRGQNIGHDSKLSTVGCNVNFYQEKEAALHLLTYERGVEDFTLACGTGAIATALIHHIGTEQNTGDFVQVVKPDGGILEIGYHFEETNNVFSQIWLKGSARIVFEGDIDV